MRPITIGFSGCLVQKACHVLCRAMYDGSEITDTCHVLWQHGGAVAGSRCFYNHLAGTYVQENKENYDASAEEVSYGAAIQLHHPQVAPASSSGCMRELARCAMAEEGPQGEQKLA